jgi:hypothetical protein
MSQAYDGQKERTELDNHNSFVTKKDKNILTIINKKEESYTYQILLLVASSAAWLCHRHSTGQFHPTYPQNQIETCFSLASSLQERVPFEF